jgi:hypothetical protein
VVLVTGVALGVVALFAPGVVTTVVVFALGWLLIVGSVRGLWSVVRAHGSRRGIGSSDAYLMSRRLRAVPGVFWLLTFAIAIGAAAWYAGSSVIDVVASLGRPGSG